MTNQYQEHQDFEFGRASEFQNCLSEAEQAMRDYKPVVMGEGPYEIRVETPFYCKATDAIVGSVLSVVNRFEDITAAIDCLSKLDEMQENGECSAILVGPGL